MNIVLDTSVLVAALRSRQGASHQLLQRLPSPDFTPALTVALYMEWQAVLTRPEHLPPGVDAGRMLGFLRYLASIAHLQDVHYLWRPFLRDPEAGALAGFRAEARRASRSDFRHMPRPVEGA